MARFWIGGVVVALLLAWGFQERRLLMVGLLALQDPPELLGFAQGFAAPTITVDEWLMPGSLRSLRIWTHWGVNSGSTR